LVDKAKEKGFTGVKFYGTFNPDGSSPASRKRTSSPSCSRHIPAGLRSMDAINAGYDEITPIN